MKIPKIIFVDGITGSGKSTMAHYIARQLNKNGIKAKWLTEDDQDHPLVKLDKIENETDDNYIIRTYKDYPQKWVDFIENIKEDEYTYIIECYFFMQAMWDYLNQDYNREDTKKHLHNLYSKLNGLDVAVILLYQNDIRTAIRGNQERRGDWFREMDANSYDSCIFSINRNLKGEDAYVRGNEEIMSICLEVFEEISFNKLKIENSAHDWKTYRQQILDFIGISLIEEKLFDPLYEEYCGYYSGYLLHIKNNRLCVDQSINNLKLIKTGIDEFQFESENSTFKFLRNNKGKVEAMQIISAYGIKHIGLILKKYNKLELENEKLLTYCGHYWCEDEGANNEIFLDNGILYTNIYRPSLRPLLVQDDRQLNVKDTTIEFYFNADDDKISFLYHDPLDKDLQFKKFDALKFDTLKLEDHELMPFCGEYWCEVEKLNRKIILENNKLYYTRDDNSRSRLFAIENKIFILADTPIKVIFNSNNDVANFAFHQTNSKVLHFSRVE